MKMLYKACMRRLVTVLTIAVVVGSEGDVDVLDDGEEEEAVDDEGERAEKVVRVADAVAERARVDEQRRRANVAVQDAHALERQPRRPSPAILPVLARAGGSGRGRVQRVLPPHLRRRVVDLALLEVDDDDLFFLVVMISSCGLGHT